MTKKWYFSQKNTKTMTVRDYISKLQSVEEYAFSLAEVVEQCKSPMPTIRKELNRLSHRNEIINLRKGFYLIIPQRYSQLGKVPLQLYVKKLFDYLERDYYIGLYSAATLHGASHHGIQQDYIITKQLVLRDIEKEKHKLRFFTASKWSEKNIVRLKSDAGLFNVSSPALTVVDLIYYQTKIGGTNRILPILEELFDQVTKEDLIDLLSWYPNNSVLQRTGFLMDEMDAQQELSALLFEHFKKEKIYPTLLYPRVLDTTTKGEHPKQKSSSTKNRWKIDVNVKLEMDT